MDKTECTCKCHGQAAKAPSAPQRAADKQSSPQPAPAQQTSSSASRTAQQTEILLHPNTFTFQTSNELPETLILPSITINTVDLLASPNTAKTTNVTIENYHPNGVAYPMATVAVTLHLKSDAPVRCACCQGLISSTNYREHKRRRPRECLLHKVCGSTARGCEICEIEWERQVMVWQYESRVCRRLRGIF